MKPLNISSTAGIPKQRVELESAQVINVAEAYATSMGALGGILLTDTTAITGEFGAMVVLEDAVFTTLTTSFTKNGIVTPAVAADFGTLPKGFVLSCPITAVTLTSGKVLLIK